MPAMIHYTVLIPQRNATEAVGRQLPELCAVLSRLKLPYEVLCIDDASDAPQGKILEELLTKYPMLRILRLAEARGVSAALSAGIAAARGDIVIAMAPGLQYRAEEIP